MTANRELSIDVSALIDDCMQGLNQILSTLQEIPDQINTDINISGDAEQGVTDLTTGVDNLNNTQLAIPVDTSSVTDLDSDAITAANDIEGMGSAAEDASSRIQSAMDDAGTSINNVGSDASGASSDTSGVGSDTSTADGLGTAVASVGIEAGIAAAVNGAGDYEDSMKRIGTDQDHMVETSAQVSAKWGGTMSQMSSDTERSMGSIRGDVAVMGVVGVHSTDSIRKGFDLMSGAAFNTKQPIESVETAYARVIATGTLGSRQLRALGSSVEELKAKTGLTAAQATQEMAGMSSEQKAAFLNSIIDTDKNRAGIEAYKGSWEETLAATQNTGDYLSRVLGGTVLPTVTTALDGVNWALGGFVGFLDNLPQPIKGVVDGVIGLGIYFVGATAAVAGLSFALGKVPESIINVFKELPLINKIPENILGRSVLENWLRMWIKVGGDLVNIAKNIGRNVLSVIKGEGWTGWTEATGKNTKNALTIIGKEIDEDTPGILSKIKGLGTKIEYGFKDALSWNFAEDSKVIDDLVKGINTSIIKGETPITNSAEDLGRLLPKGVGDRINEGTPEVEKDIDTFSSKIADTIKSIKFPKFNIFGDEKGGVNTDFIGDIIKSIESKLPSLKSISELIPKTISDGIKGFKIPDINLGFLDNFTKGLTSKLPSLDGIGSKIPDFLSKGITKALPKLVGSGGDILVVVSQAIQNVYDWPKLKDKGPVGVLLEQWGLELPAPLKKIDDLLSFDKIWTTLVGPDVKKRLDGAIENNIRQPIMNALNPLPGKIMGWLSGVPGAIEKPFNDAGTWLKTLPANMLKWGGDAIQGIVDGIYGKMGSLGKSITDLWAQGINPALQWLWDLPGNMYKWGSDGLNGLVNGVYSIFGGLGKSISAIWTDGINPALQWLWDLPGNMYKWGKDAIWNLAKGINDGIPGATGLEGALKSVGDHFPKSPPKTGPLSEVKAENMRSWMHDIAYAGIDGFKDFTLPALGNLPKIPNYQVSQPLSTNNGPKEIHLTVDLSNVPANMPLKTAKVVATQTGNTVLEGLKEQAITKGYSVVNGSR